MNRCPCESRDPVTTATSIGRQSRRLLPLRFCCGPDLSNNQSPWLLGPCFRRDDLVAREHHRLLDSRARSWGRPPVGSPNLNASGLWPSRQLERDGKPDQTPLFAPTLAPAVAPKVHS